MLPVECIVRGYITGSGWKDYKATGAVSGIALPDGLQESEQLPEPIYTPSTKAEEGHDEAIDFAETVRLLGSRGARGAGARRLDRGLQGGRRARPRARRDPGRHEVRVRRSTPTGVLTLGDEVCTPDSSRFWPADTYEVGHGQPSFDKQYVRDWATVSGLGQAPAGAADPGRRGRADARALRHGLRAARGRAVRRVAGPGRREPRPRPDPAQGRDPRSAGPGRRARAAGAGLRGRRRTCTSAGSSSWTWRTPRGRRRCARSCSPTR